VGARGGIDAFFYLICFASDPFQQAIPFIAKRRQSGLFFFFPSGEGILIGEHRASAMVMFSFSLRLTLHPYYINTSSRARISTMLHKHAMIKKSP
jgi:hypothetical protein